MGSKIITAPDSHNELNHRFRAEAQSGALIISTGGLGPTTDDHTRDLFHPHFQFTCTNQLAMAHLKAYCHRRQRNLSTEINGYVDASGIWRSFQMRMVQLWGLIYRSMAVDSVHCQVFLLV